VIDLAVLQTARVAVVGLEVTTGQPPMIVQTAVYHVDAGSIMAGPLCCWVDPDAPWNQIRVSAWPTVRLSPRWPEVAERVTGLIADRFLAVTDRDRLDVLRRHLPDWHPVAVLLLDELAEQAAPRLAHTSPDRAEVPGSPGHDPGPRARRGAIAEAHDAALLLGTLTNHANYRSQTTPAGPARQAARQVRLGTRAPT